jgi:hypothetical protein
MNVLYVLVKFPVNGLEGVTDKGGQDDLLPAKDGQDDLLPAKDGQDDLLPARMEWTRQFRDINGGSSLNYIERTLVFRALLYECNHVTLDGDLSFGNRLKKNLIYKKAMSRIKGIRGIFIQ